MIFPKIVIESKVRIGDKTRIDVSGTFVTPDEAAITLIEVQPSAADSFIDVTTLSYLDWCYAAEATETITLRVTTDGAPDIAIATINILSEENDVIFSNDNDLVKFEHDILAYVRAGRNSYIDVHRKMKTIILAELANKRILGADNAKLTEANLTDQTEVREWSTFGVLSMIFQGLIVSPDDVFTQKFNQYSEYAKASSSRYLITIDEDGDDQTDNNKQVDLLSVKMVRR